MSTEVAIADIEAQFIQWLAVRADGVKWKYQRWLETSDGAVDLDAYCPECASIQRYVERHNKTGFTRISGWDEWYQEDGPQWCARCGVLLYHSLTAYGLGLEIAGGEDTDGMSPEDAAIMHHAMTCGGEYESDRENLWPLIEPHAKRLMEASE